MNELNFKYKEKRFSITFYSFCKNSEIYEKVAQELKLDPQKIIIHKIKRNKENYEYNYTNETYLIELDDENKDDNQINFSKRNKSGFLGLKNNDVFYLNCFLQSFYMITPFKNMIINWNWEDYHQHTNKDSIIRNFQFLFTELERLDSEYSEPNEYFTERVHTDLRGTKPSEFFSKVLSLVLDDLQIVNFNISVYLEMFCLRVDTDKPKNFASIEIDPVKTFEEGVSSFFSNVTKFNSLPPYLFIFVGRMRDYKFNSTSVFAYPPSFKIKNIVEKCTIDAEFELLQVCYHIGNYIDEKFGVVVKNELKEQYINFYNQRTFRTSKEELLSYFSDNEGEKESAVYLVYRKIDQKSKIQAVEIPMSLINDTKKEAEYKERKRLEKIQRRDMITMNVYLGKCVDEVKPWKLEISEVSKQVSFNRSGDIAHIAKQAAKEWNISENENTFRIRKYNQKYKVAVETFNSNELFMMAHISAYDTLILEVFPLPNHTFTENKGMSYILGVVAYNKETNSFSQLEYIPFGITLLVSELKYQLQNIVNFPASTMRVYYENSYDNTEKELNNPNKILRETPLIDGYKIYVEDFDGVSEFSPCLLELENYKNQSEILYNSSIETGVDFENTPFDKSIKIDKRVSVSDLLQLVSIELNVEVEELRVFNIFEREKEKVRAEIKNLAQSLSEIVKNKQRISLFFEKGKPFLQQEVTLNFFHYLPSIFSYLEKTPFNNEEIVENENHNLKPKMYTELFDYKIKSNTPISKLRELVFEQLENFKIDKPPSPLYIRLREIYANVPSHILPNIKDLSFCESVNNIIYNGKPIAFQILDIEEPVISKNSVVPVIQKWNPSTYTFGPKIEIILDRDMAVEDLRNLLSKKYNIEKVGFAKSTKIEIFHSDMENLIWDPNSPLFVANKRIKVATLSSSPFYLSDGHTLYFKDNNEKEMTLGPKEKTRLELFMKNNKSITLISQKEKGKKNN